MSAWQVSEGEFVIALVGGLLPLSGYTMAKVESIVLELLSRRIRCEEGRVREVESIVLELLSRRIRCEDRPEGASDGPWVG